MKEGWAYWDKNTSRLRIISSLLIVSKSALIWIKIHAKIIILEKLNKLEAPDYTSYQRFIYTVYCPILEKGVRKKVSFFCKDIDLKLDILHRVFIQKRKCI